MMDILSGALFALWLGILNSLSPCPLTTNIAAVSFIGKGIGSINCVLFSGLAYPIGRSSVYLVTGVIAVAGLLSIPGISFFLQQNINKILGPMLFLTGIFMPGIIPIILIWKGFEVKRKKSSGGNIVLSSGLLGMAFALAFYPVSAALFFGSLIPLAVKQNSPVIMPVVYGIATGLPVLSFAFLIAFSTRSVGKTF
jgi:cytochrome c-type biogenesis protein